MKINVLSALKILAVPALAAASLVSCKKAFDITPKNVVDASDAYRNVNDADAAVTGIYGQLMDIAGQYVVLNELRGDLMDVTPQADHYLKQINTMSVTPGNPWADPRPFYRIILNCNDALSNFKKMVQDNRMTETDFSLRYSTVGAIRSWLYLELGIQFGNVPYVTAPLANLDAVNDPNNYPRLSFDQLLDSLITFTQALPFKDPFPDGTSLVTSVDGYSTEKFFIPIKILLGDLYLWKGDYTQAAVNYHYMMNYADILYPAKNSEQWYETYKIAYTGNINGANWVNIFSQPYGERYSNYEIMWDMPFDRSFSPTNPFISLFYNKGADYQLKPSQLAINDWNAQTRNDNTPGDFRGEDASWKLVNGEPVINKFISNYSPLSPFATEGKWILYRAGGVTLHYAEAANRAGRNQLAYALLNWGLKYTFDPEHLNTSHDSRDVGPIEQSFGAPFDFDARQGDDPTYRSAWYRNVGIRGRVDLPLHVIDSSLYFDMGSADSLKPVIDRRGLTLTTENNIIDEDGLELAFEGERWPDLLRIALRREKAQAGSGVAFLQQKIAAKFTAAGEPAEAAAISAKLANPQNWYLPFSWK
jgi:hypothetical protein